MIKTIKSVAWVSSTKDFPFTIKYSAVPHPALKKNQQYIGNISFGFEQYGSMYRSSSFQGRGT